MRRFWVFVLLVSLFGGIAVVAAQDSAPAVMGTPAVSVSDQVSLDGTVTIASVFHTGPGFIVIHRANDEGGIGPVIGQRALSVGQNTNVRVAIDAASATSTVFAMLHDDTCEVGTYEFGTVQGCDTPVRVDGQVVTPAFKIAVIRAFDQAIVDDMVTVASVTVEVDGWLVLHSDGGGRPGPVLGQTQISAGTTTDVSIEVAADGRTVDLWPMLHVDSCEIGTYEFGTVQGCDGPVNIGGVATMRITTNPAVRMSDQIVIHGDNYPGAGMMGEMTPSVTAESVHSAGPGVLVIHVDNNGAPGPVAGWALVEDGVSTNVVVMLDQDVPLTPVLWPMLHVDSCTVGAYEFGTVQGCDGPVRVDERVLTFPINAAPSMTFSDQALTDGAVVITSALIDAAGWLVIHQDNNGAPGPVLANYQLTPGHNVNIIIPVDAAAAGGRVFPMLHYDTNGLGAYEFGSVQGADAPVFLNGAVVVAPLVINP